MGFYLFPYEDPNWLRQGTVRVPEPRPAVCPDAQDCAPAEALSSEDHDRTQGDRAADARPCERGAGLVSE